MNLYVLVPTDHGFHHLGGNHAHGAIPCRECLIQHDHGATDGGIALSDMHLEPAVCQIKGCLHAANAAPDNQNRALHHTVACDSILVVHINANSFKSVVLSTKCRSICNSATLMPVARPISSVRK